MCILAVTVSPHSKKRGGEMNKKETEKNKAAEIAKLAQSIRKATESVANLFKILERPSVKLSIEIENFYREACDNQVSYAVINYTRGTYTR
ncbi:membrane GTPase [Candidatus Scalindua japonica]|uniref:Membrane GTPase n=2 Tax=Candidatus Scalindua japonica TaxID=1284222 RepID=A0A286U030_9BACT|nr:membrane GTPase [Candidatus Scalindua japonica]